MNKIDKKQLVSKKEAKYKFQSKIIITFSLIGTIAFGIFGFLHATNNNDLTAIVELVVSLSLLLNLISFRIVDKAEPFSSILLAVLTLGLIYLMYNSGIQFTGIAWIYTMPIVAFSVKGTKYGAIWTIIILLSLICFTVVSYSQIIDTPYSWIQYRQYATAYIVISILIFMSILYLEQREQIFIKQDEKLQKINEKLEQTIKQINIEKARIQAFLNSIGDGIVGTNKNGKIVLINKVAQKISGKTFLKLKGKRVEEIFNIYKKKKKVPASKFPNKFILKNRGKNIIYRSFTEGYQLKTPDGNYIPISITTAPVIVNGETIGSISILHDSTKEARVDREKTEFISMASHQLRTPLTNLSWTLDLLSDELKLTKEEKDILQNADTSVSIMKTLVKDLLNVSRIETGKVRVEKKDIILQEVLKEQMKQMKTLGNEKNCKFKFKKPKNPIEAHTDPKLIAQILDVFVSNAVRYSKPGKCSVTIELLDKKDTFTIKIQDKGIGISKKAQKKLFTKFFRSEKARDFAPQGSGLGLYYAQIITRALDAKINFTSEAGKGSEFQVTVPKK